MQVKLTELYKTKYFYKSYEVDLNYLFSVCRHLQRGDEIQYNAPTELHKRLYEAASRHESIVFDVADCKLGTDCAIAIRNEQQAGGKFVDSSDSYRNKILQDNTQHLRPVDMEVRELPKIEAGAAVTDYIRALEKGICYTVPARDSDQYVYLVVLIALTRPKSVTVDVSSIMEKLIRIVSSNLTVKALCKYKSFWFQNSEIGPIGLEFNGKTTMLPGVGEVTISEAANYGELMPSDFGRVRLIEDTDWYGLRELCLANVNNYVARQTYTLREVIYGSD